MFSNRKNQGKLKPLKKGFNLISFKMEEKKSNEELRFAEIIAKVVSGATISENEKTEIVNLSNKIGAKIEVEEGTDKSSKKTCVWVCQNNFACNPDYPPPNCRCRRVCW